MYYIHQTLADAEAALSAAQVSESMLEESSQEARDIVEAVEAALCDDLNTPQAVALLSEPLKKLNDLLHTKKVRAIPVMA